MSSRKFDFLLAYCLLLSGKTQSRRSDRFFFHNTQKKLFTLPDITTKRAAQSSFSPHLIERKILMVHLPNMNNINNNIIIIGKMRKTDAANVFDEFT